MDEEVVRLQAIDVEMRLTLKTKTTRKFELQTAGLSACSLTDWLCLFTFECKVFIKLLYYVLFSKAGNGYPFKRLTVTNFTIR